MYFKACGVWRGVADSVQDKRKPRQRQEATRSRREEFPFSMRNWKVIGALRVMHSFVEQATTAINKCSKALHQQSTKPVMLL